MSRPLSNYLTVAEVARAGGLTVRSMRRRLAVFDREHPGLLVSANASGGRVRKWLVNVHLLDKITRKGSADAEWRESMLVSRVEELEARVKALRAAHLKLKRYVAAWAKAVGSP